MRLNSLGPLRLASLAIVALFPLHAQAQTERILHYHSDLTLQDDGTLLVRELIRVFATGNQIRHGIYRDFPTRYKDNSGNRYVVGFQVTEATRDGAPEPFRVEDYSNGKRVYLGDRNSFVPRGEHTYTISYNTNRQLGFFKDHDELFWNVTGNGWGFAIERASATVRLPDKIPAADVQITGFTGPQGSQARDLTGLTKENTFTFASNHPLPPNSGLTILLSWPKGYVTAPTVQERLQYLFRDNQDALWIAVALLVLLVYYLLVWSAVGRDPDRGVIMPRYEPPANLSPAAIRYLVRMGYDNKTFTAAVLDMAVRGFLTIKEDFGSYTLNRTKADNRVLSADEKNVAGELFDGQESLLLQSENHTIVSSAIHSLKTWLKVAEDKIYFFTNARYMIPAILFSAAVLVGLVMMLGGPKVMVAGFLCVWLTMWTLAVSGLILGSYHQWKAAFTSGHGQAALFGKALLLTLFTLPFLAGEGFGFFMLNMMSSSFVVAFLVASVALHILFHFLLKAPTSAGRQLLDQVEGFKMFLGAVDGDRLNRVMPPDKTPQTFEKFLPYAVALDVEQEWADKFADALGRASQASGAGTTSPTYTPSFYSGAAWNGSSFSGFTDSLSSFTSAISASSSAPGSGDGGGSGGSGGGGGGGGGGGW